MQHLVFLGDSVTDCSRKRAIRYATKTEGLGSGWVSFVAKALKASLDEHQIWNRGYSGSLTSELIQQEHWWPEQDDSIIESEISTLMIGINDIWHPFWRGREHDISLAAESLEHTLITLKQRSKTVVVIEPIALPVGEVSQAWWPLLDELSQLQEQVCQRQQVHWLALQESLMKSAQSKPEDYLADGVHPTDLGHRWLAKQWLGFVQNKNLL